jgi:hypothetical protein
LPSLLPSHYDWFHVIVIPTLRSCMWWQLDVHVRSQSLNLIKKYFWSYRSVWLSFWIVNQIYCQICPSQLVQTQLVHWKTYLAWIPPLSAPNAFTEKILICGGLATGRLHQPSWPEVVQRKKLLQTEKARSISWRRINEWLVFKEHPQYNQNLVRYVLP